jgi:2-dehydropantoate 2-reductase
MALEEQSSARDDNRRYVIIGAGAIGGTVGAVLTRAGIPTALVARGRHAETLAAAGLTLRTPDGTFHTPVAAVSGAEDVRLTPDDVLVFTTKTQQLDVALRQWVDQPVHGPDSVLGTAGDLLPVLTALNGVAAEEKALRYFRQVFGVCVWLPAVHLEPGGVIVRSWPVVGQFHIGRWPASLRTRTDAELLQGLAGAWTAAGIRVRLVDDVAPWKYNKLLSNLGNSRGCVIRRRGGYQPGGGRDAC